MRRWFSLCLLTCLTIVQLVGAQPIAAESLDWPIANGRFFTQTGGDTGGGFAVTDDGGIPFWTTFQQLGGADVVGYPISHRFVWEGFTVQAFQRVVFQWNPNDEAVHFVNVFDRLGALGHDDWLLSTRQTPKPIAIDEAGKTWDEIVQGRLALLDARPAIRDAYLGVAGDPIQMNGLPTSEIVDMGNHYALRAQRIVLQEWKEDVPWARAGAVTVALGGDIAKEVGLFPAEATDPAVVYTHSTDRFSIQIPTRWTHQEANSTTRVILASPIDGKGAPPSVTIVAEPTDSALANRDLFTERSMSGYKTISLESITLAGQPATRRVYTLGSAAEFEMRVIQVSLDYHGVTYTLNAAAASERFDRYAPTFEWVLASFTPPTFDASP